MISFWSQVCFLDLVLTSGESFFESILVWGLVFGPGFGVQGWFLDLVLVAGPVFGPRFLAARSSFLDRFWTSGARFWTSFCTLGLVF